jgi:hypothetical protein
MPNTLSSSLENPMNAIRADMQDAPQIRIVLHVSTSFERVQRSLVISINVLG